MTNYTSRWLCKIVKVWLRNNIWTKMYEKVLDIKQYQGVKNSTLVTRLCCFPHHVATLAPHLAVWSTPYLASMESWPHWSPHVFHLVSSSSPMTPHLHPVWPPMWLAVCLPSGPTIWDGCTPDWEVTFNVCFNLTSRGFSLTSRVPLHGKIIVMRISKKKIVKQTRFLYQSPTRLNWLVGTLIHEYDFNESKITHIY